LNWTFFREPRPVEGQHVVTTLDGGTGAVNVYFFGGIVETGAHGRGQSPLA
jgi:hypothetical protein